MLCAVLATNDVLVAAFEDMVDRVAGKADLTVAGSGAGIPSSLTGEIAEVEGVEHAAAMLEVVTRSADKSTGSLLVLGVDFLGDTFFLPFAQDGKKGVVDDPLAFVNDPTAILVSKRLAKDRNLKVGSALNLMTSFGPKTFYVRGLLDNKGPAASSGGQVVVMFIDAAQVSFGRGYAVDRIDVVVSKDAQLAKVQRAIEAVVAGKAKVEAPQGRTQRMAGALWTFKNGLNMSGIIALCVGMFLIYNAVSVSVAQRRREVGTLRALGVTKSRMVLLFGMEASVMALLGVALGLALGQVLAKVAVAAVADSVNRFVVPIHTTTPKLTPSILVWGALAGFSTTLLAAYLPARSTNQISAAEALRSERSTVFARIIDDKKLALKGLLFMGIAILVAALGGELNGYLAAISLNVGAALFVPLAIKLLRITFVKPVEAVMGIPGRLALDNVQRTLGRSAITVVALMLAVAMSMSVGGYAKSFEESLLSWADNAFPADAAVSFGSPLLDRQHLAFSADVLGKLHGVEGLATVDAARSVLVDHGGRRMELQAFDTRPSFEQSQRRQRGRQVISGPSPLPVDALSEKPRILISENAARFQRLSAGDTIRLDTPSGSRAFEVYAVIIDYSSDQGTILMDRKWYREYWQDELIDAIVLYFEDGANPDQMAARIRDRLRDNEGLFVTLQSGLRKELRSTAQSLFAYARAPELITLIVAIMGVVGTMLAAILDRIREIGMIRAIGATRKQVVFSLVAEAGFLGLSAAACGVAAGVPLGYLLLKVVGTATSGWDLHYDFPIETALRMSLFVTGAAALAGSFPGRQVARMDVKEALSYE
jgi:putative ABC transport system permease protein